MKKNLFYAAFAIAMMASCTNEDNLVVDPVEPTPEDKVAITLGIDAPAVNATVGARGTGSVGDVAGANNKWNSQQLYITMIDRATGAVAKNNGANIMAWDQYTYMAPRADDQTTGQEGKGTIRIYPEDATLTDDKGFLQYEYYPVQGTYDFYGWHLDDATATTDITANAETAEGAGDGYPTIKLTNITINGTQDIMGAKTKAANSTTYTNWNTELEGWAFSARTARNEIDPILAFEHKLARVKFFVKAGSESAALYNNNGTKKEVKKINDNTSTGAMYITAIKAQNMHSTFDMTLDKTGIATSNPGNTTTFNLGDICIADYTNTANTVIKKGQVDTLVHVAPNYWKDYAGQLADGVTKEAQVGHAMMFLPVTDLTAKSLTFNLDLKQYVQTQEDETDGEEGTGANDLWNYETRLNVPVTVNASNVKLPNSNTAVTAFEAGKSYNVYITIYGFERIEVSAELTPWVDGGNVDVDIENGTSQGPATPVTKDFTFNVTNNTSEVTIKVNDQPITGTTYSATADFTWEVTDGTTTKTGSVDFETATETTINVDLTAAQTPATTVVVTFTATYTPEGGEETTAQNPTILVWEGIEEYSEGTSVKVELSEGKYNLSKDKSYSYSVKYTTEDQTVTYVGSGQITDLATTDGTTKDIAVTLTVKQ